MCAFDLIISPPPLPLLLLLLLPLLLLPLLLLLLLTRANHECDHQHTHCTLLLQQKRLSRAGTNLFWVGIQAFDHLAVQSTFAVSRKRDGVNMMIMVTVLIRVLVVAKMVAMMITVLLQKRLFQAQQLVQHNERNCNFPRWRMTLHISCYVMKSEIMYSDVSAIQA
jgi:hypothetical protein